MSRYLRRTFKALFLPKTLSLNDSIQQLWWIIDLKTVFLLCVEGKIDYKYPKARIFICKAGYVCLFGFTLFKIKFWYRKTFVILHVYNNMVAGSSWSTRLISYNVSKTLAGLLLVWDGSVKTKNKGLKLNFPTFFIV